MTSTRQVQTFSSVLLVIFFLLSAALVVFGYRTYQNQARDILQTHYQELSTIASLKVDQIADWRAERLNNAELTTHLTPFEAKLRQVLTAPKDAALLQTVSADLELLRRSHKYANVVVLDRQGRIVVSLDPRLAHLGPELPEFARKALASDKPMMGEPFHCSDCGRIHLDTLNAIRSQNRSPLGVVVLRSNLEDHLFPHMQTWPTPSATAETLLVRRVDDHIVFLNPLRHNPAPPLSIRFPMTKTELPAVQAVLGKTGMFHGRDYQGMEVLADLRPITNSTWFMVAKVDTLEILAETKYRGRLILLLTGLAILMLGALLGGVFYFTQAQLYQGLFEAAGLVSDEMPQTQPTEARRLKAAGRLCGAAVLALGLIGLLGGLLPRGWQLNPMPGGIPMKASVGLGLGLAGGALMGWHQAIWRRSCAAGLLVLGGITLLQFMAGWNFGIDHWLIHEQAGALGPGAPSRMSSIAALAFFMFGICFSLPEKWRHSASAQGVTLSLGLTGIITLLSYLFGGLSGLLQQSVPASLALALTSAGHLLITSDCGIMRTVFADTMSGWLLRRVIPLVVGFVIAIAWVRSIAERFGLIEPPLAIALMTVVVIVLLLGGALWFTRALERMDAIRRRAELQELTSAREVRAMLYGIGDGIIATDAAGKILHMNPVAERLTGYTEKDSLGLPLESVFKLVHEYTRESLPSPLARVLELGEATTLPDQAVLVDRLGRERSITDSAAPIRDAQGILSRIVLIFRDQTEEHRMRQLFQIRLDLTDYAETHSLRELLAKTLDEMGRMASSPIGFYHFYDATTQSLTLQQWSTRTRAEFCTASETPYHYPLTQAGVWADCIRERRAIIHNDYESLPNKKGLPSGHAQVIRELVVPVIRGSEVVAILGVGNKAEPYTEQDVQTVSYLADLTWSMVERKASQAELAAREARYRELHESLRDAYVQTDLSGRFLESNQVYRDMLGYSDDELRALTYVEITPAEWHGMEAQIVQDEILAKGYSPVYEKAYRCKDGTILPAELRSFLLKDDRGNPSGMWAIVRDITARKLDEAKLRNAERMARGTLDGLSAHIAILDEQGEIIQVNRAWERFADENPPVQGLVNTGANYFQVCDAVKGADELPAKAFLAGIRSVMSGELQEYIQEYPCHSPETLRWFLGRVTRFAGEGPLRVVVSHNNITPQKLAEMALLAREEEINQLNINLERRVEERTQALAEANQELESFAYSVSHDLRAPLRHMDGFISLLQSHLGNALDSKGAHYLDVAKRAAERMAQLIDGLLSFSRLGRTELRKMRIDTPLLVQSVIEEFKEECAGRNVHWILNPLPEAEGDPTLLRLVFQNLIGNALKFTRTQPETCIEICALEELAGECGFLVRDNGVGFDPTYVHKLFGVFQRLHREDEFEGTGIGLANVQRIILRHGGRVWAEGMPGAGASFFFTLPNERKDT